MYNTKSIKLENCPKKTLDARSGDVNRLLLSFRIEDKLTLKKALDGVIR